MSNDKTILSNVDPKKTVDIISGFIKDVLEKSKSDGLVVGLSGGIDSSVVTFIAAQSVSREKILGLIMPSQTSSADDMHDALSVAEVLGIKKKIIPVDNIIQRIGALKVDTASDEKYKIAQANLIARARMMILYYHANAMNRLVLGTGNKSELLVGYFTKYGDGGVDLNPLGDLYKTDVQKIGIHLSIPINILNKPPAAGLWHGQTDEDELGITYELLDEILYLLEDEKLLPHQIAIKLDIPEEEVLRVMSLIISAEHKLVPPPLPKIRRN
ncbi:MAG TPA: NAD+ synthase [Methanobacterium sp.]|jgi:NAD+ synthase|nr:MAG: NAD+ synthase [Methanobacterium sp.]HOI72082.1 NAD+ synthase [Methanobacterium sp.]HPX77487.1 NAD+ synthase [Methanobacterium sp.]